MNFHIGFPEVALLLSLVVIVDELIKKIRQAKFFDGNNNKIIASINHKDIDVKIRKLNKDITEEQALQEFQAMLAAQMISVAGKFNIDKKRMFKTVYEMSKSMTKE